MLRQEALIARVRARCREDDRLVAALMYGSFAAGEGDAFSDVEFILYFKNDELPTVDQAAWVKQIAPVELFFTNEFGVGSAIFADLIRGEFHFDPASAIAAIDESWRETDFLPALDPALVLDRTGELTERLRAVVGPPLDRSAPARAAFLCRSLVNWLLFGWTVLERGEAARALHLLGFVQRYLLWLARLREGAVAHWGTPSRALEADLSPTAYARYAACTAPLAEPALRAAYRAAWAWGKELIAATAGEAAVPGSLVARLDRRLEPENPDRS